MIQRLLAITFFCFLGFQLIAQTSEKEMVVKGKVREELGQPVSNTIIINRRTKSGAYGNPDGTFEITCYKSDTISVTALGYHTRILTFSDSVDKDVYTPEIYLEIRPVVLPTAVIFAPRDLEKINADIKKLGYNEEDFRLSGIDALQSPITFLYMEFSRKEQSKRLVAEMENADRKRELLKELFHYYVDYQIIDLSNEEFDDFIDFINVSDDFLKTTSQYDFLIFVKSRFEDYKVHRRRNQSMDDTDYDYDKD